MFNLGSEAGYKVDIMFLADSTGSMTAAMNDVKANFLNAYNSFKGATSWDVGVGISYYKDAGSDADPFKVLTTITQNSTVITAAIQSLNPTGGGDAPEDQLMALQLLASRGTTGWRAGATRIIAWFGDQPGHRTVSYGGNTYTIDSVMEALKDRNVFVCAFSMAPSNQLDAYGQATQITNETNGVTDGRYLKANVKQAGVVESIFNFIRQHTP